MNFAVVGEGNIVERFVFFFHFFKPCACIITKCFGAFFNRARGRFIRQLGYKFVHFQFRRGPIAAFILPLNNYLTLFIFCVTVLG